MTKDSFPLTRFFLCYQTLENVENYLYRRFSNETNRALSVARSASSKLDQMLSVQKSSSDKTRLGYVDSICVSAPHSTKFIPSSSSFEPSVSEIVSETVKPSVSEVAKPLAGSSSRKIRVDLKESKPKKPTLSKDKTHDKPAWVCHFLWKDWTHTSKLLQAASCKLQREQTNQKYLCLKHLILWYLLVIW